VIRTQEPGGVNIVTYPRNLEGVVRKKDERRKAQRESHAQRKAEKAIAEQEQVKRMKSVKRREIDERFANIPIDLIQSLHILARCRRTHKGDKNH